MSQTESTNPSSEVRFTGRVKYFNRKKGYGFVTISEGDRSGEDIFAHHTKVHVDTEQFRYLVQGEYVTFTIIDADGDHESQAGDIRGVSGGSLMCEVGRESGKSQEQNPKPRRQRSSRGRGGRGRQVQKGKVVEQKVIDSADGSEWILMKRKPRANVHGRGRGRGRGHGGRTHQQRKPRVETASTPPPTTE